MKSAKGIDPKDGQAEVSPDYAAKLGMAKAREQLEDMPYTTLESSEGS